MKFTAIFLLPFLMISCTAVIERPPFLPIEYTFPQSQISNGKTFVWLDQGDADDTSYNDRFHIKKNGTTYLVDRKYSAWGTSDSIVFLGARTYETYLGSETFSSKGKVIRDEIARNGKKLGKNILEVEYDSDSALLTILTESEYVKDSIFEWNGKIYPVLKIKTMRESKITDKMNSETPLLIYRQESSTYEAKGLGTVRIEIPKTLTGSSRVIELVSIRDIKSN